MADPKRKPRQGDVDRDTGERRRQEGTSPGRAHLLAFEAPNLLITSYPLVMVPTFAVPLALMLHGLVLWRLRREAPATNRLVAA